MLREDVGLVVPISSCLDQFCFGLSADGAASEDSQITGPLEQGVYRITWTFSFRVMTSTANTSYLLVNLGTIVAPVLFITIAKYLHGIGGQVVEEQRFGSLEVHLPEGAKIEAIAGALGISNVTAWRVVIQPL